MIIDRDHQIPANRSNRPKVFLGKEVMKIYSNFIEIALRHG